MVSEFNTQIYIKHDHKFLVLFSIFTFFPCSVNPNFEILINLYVNYLNFPLDNLNFILADNRFRQLNRHRQVQNIVLFSHKRRPIKTGNYYWELINTWNKHYKNSIFPVAYKRLPDTHAYLLCLYTNFSISGKQYRFKNYA